VSSAPPKKSTSLACISLSLASISACILSAVGGPNGLCVLWLDCCCPFAWNPCMPKLDDIDLNPLNIALMPSVN